MLGTARVWRALSALAALACRDLQITKAVAGTGAGAGTEDCFSLASETTGVSGLAERYAAALFELADERRTLDEVALNLRQLQAMLQASGDFLRLIRSPILSRSEQAKAIGVVAERAELSSLVCDFLAVMAGNRRLFALPAIIEAFLHKLATRRGEVNAQVTAAQRLSEAQLAALNEQLRRVAQGIVVEQLQEIAAMRAALGEKLTPAEATLAPTSVGSAEASHLTALRQDSLVPTSLSWGLHLNWSPGSDVQVRRIAQEIIVDQIECRCHQLPCARKHP